MVIDALAGLFMTVMTGVFGMAPAYSPDGSFTDAGGGLGGALGAVNGVVPVATIGLCLVAVLAARVFLMGWSVIVFVYDRFPLKFT